MKFVRIAKWTGLLLLVLLVAGAITVYSFFHVFYPSAPAVAFAPASDAASAQQQDLDYFKNYFELDRAYTPQAREQAQALWADYRAKAGTLSAAEFDLAIARMVALADNGHSQWRKGSLSRRHDRLPCRLYHFAGGYFVLRAHADCEPLLGAQVLAMDGHPIEDVAEQMYAYSGGPRNHYDQFASVFLLESPELLHAAGLAQDPRKLDLHVRLPDGSERDVSLVADAPDAGAPRVYSDSYLSPQRIEGESADWKSLLAADAALPLFLRDYADPFRSEFLADKGVFYADFRSNSDEPGHSIGAFVDTVQRNIIAKRPRAIVLDLRLDQGGNFVSTAGLMKHLTDLADSVEHVYVLTSAWTFSAGDISVALARQHGGAKLTVIGEPVGDRIRLWAEGNDIVLPNSKLSIGFATGLHDYRHSCFGEAGCFWTMFFFPMQVASLEPDIAVPYRFSDYVALRDPVLERALEMAAAK